ncbi:hypothetical protein ACVRWQ_05860 [Streptococcus phocae subsp. salmonis]|nr:hypothetical protein [Streptococcus phocae]QBX27814.1 hypothetical protein Javan420_0014 [Streptococcus phage Javan420]
MKLFDFIFAKPKPQKRPDWTIENNGWQKSRDAYNKRHKLGNTVI